MSDALKKARRAFQKKNLSSSEESLDSISSGEFSHIPIPDTEISKLTNLLTMANGSAIENTLAEIADSLRILTTKSAEHDRLLQHLSQQVGNNEPGPSGLAPTPQRIAAISGDPFKIPDPIKTLPSYSGNKKQLHSWLETAEKTLKLFESLVPPEIFQIYLTAVLNKIEGHAKDVICTNGNPESFEEVKVILTTALGDKQELSTYNCLLWHNPMDGNVNKHYSSTKQLVQNIKTLAKQNALYNAHWEAINSFIDEYSLAAYMSGLQKPYFGYAQARGPKSIEDAYAFLCKFTSTEVTRNVTTNKDKNFNKQLNKPLNENQHSNKPFNKTDNKQFTQKYTNNKPSNYSNDNTQKSITEPMDIDPSIRSRLTLNKRNINNNEISQVEASDADSSEDEEDLAINFWQTPKEDPGI